MTEAPLLVRPLLASMTPSELHCVMAGGFASVAGSVLAAYIAMGVPGAPLIASSVMSAPAAIGIGKLLYPSPRDAAACRRAIRRATPPAVELSAAVAESINGAASAPAAAPAPASTPAAADGGAVATEKEAEAEAEAEEEDDGANMMPQSTATNVFEAAADGAIGAVPLVACITATLIAFLALVSLLDAAVGWLASLIDIELTFTRLLGWLFFPFAVLIGVPLPDCELVGRLIGTKTASNEFVAYSLLAEAIAAGELSARAAQAAAVALCGFANLGSCGIMLGGLSALAPTRKADLAQGVLSAMVSGTLATMSSAAVASALYHAEAHGDQPAAPEALECGGAT
jgi:CNT family concentrative nucleoside transporter